MGGIQNGNDIFARKFCIQKGELRKRASLLSGGDSVGLEEILKMGTERLSTAFLTLPLCCRGC